MHSPSPHEAEVSGHLHDSAILTWERATGSHVHPDWTRQLIGVEPQSSS